MSQQDKSKLWKELKDAGISMDKPYAQYTEEELGAAVAHLREGMRAQAEFTEQQRLGDPDPGPTNVVPELPELPAPVEPELVAAPAEIQRSLNYPEPVLKAMAMYPGVPVTGPLEGEMAGERLNQLEEGEPIRIDPQTGFVWFQEEVRKPAAPKPRGRRVLQYTDQGTRQETVQDGKYTETFEVAGQGVPTTGIIKVTLPSYQTGLYGDLRYPWRVHTYNGQEGFDLAEVWAFYGGEHLVPPECKTKYVSNVLCYDMRSVINAVEAEHRRLQLAAAGRIEL